MIRETEGLCEELLAAVVVVTPIRMAKEAGELMASARGRRITLQSFTHLALVAGAAVSAFVFIEAALQLLARLQNPAGKSGASNALAMPAAWERRPVEIEGAKTAYYWHNILHAHNRDNMRLVGEFPRKGPGTFRIIAQEIGKELRDLPELRPYRRSQTTAGRLETTRQAAEPEELPSHRPRAGAAGSERTGP